MCVAGSVPLLLSDCFGHIKMKPNSEVKSLVCVAKLCGSCVLGKHEEVVEERTEFSVLRQCLSRLYNEVLVMSLKSKTVAETCMVSSVLPRCLHALAILEWCNLPQSAT